ncbi:hypothetical protein ACJJTC_013781 [Scirpophaga incertulas]
MFGDLGHGTIVMLFGIWMIKNEREFLRQKSDNEIWNIFFGGRYVITLLGIFSMYAGFVYNDIFSKSMSLQWWQFHPAFSPELHKSEDVMTKELFDIHPLVGRGYKFGIHPIWTMASNKIMYENSLKMKLSIIIGIGHMIFGILLSFANHL